MADSCSHQDSSRRSVSATAHLIATIRGNVSQRDKEKSWYNDPYASALGGEIGRAVWNELKTKWTKQHVERFEQAMYTRTKVIDYYIMQHLDGEDAIDQILVFGGGLDTRPWRLHLPSTSQHHLIRYFEIDFAEVFNYKLSVLSAMHAMSDFSYHAVTADLSLPGHEWLQTLQESGFSTAPGAKTLIIMEGFANYLTEEELSHVLETISSAVSVGSLFIATCITPIATHITLSNLHRFQPEHPLQFWKQFGWEGREDDVVDLAVSLLSRSPSSSIEGQSERKADDLMTWYDEEEDDAHGRGYYILRMTKVVRALTPIPL